MYIQEVMSLGNTVTYHCEYFRLKELNYLVEIAYHREKQGILLQFKLYPPSKQPSALCYDYFLF